MHTFQEVIRGLLQGLQDRKGSLELLIVGQYSHEIYQKIYQRTPSTEQKTEREPKGGMPCQPFLAYLFGLPTKVDCPSLVFYEG